MWAELDTTLDNDINMRMECAVCTTFMCHDSHMKTCPFYIYVDCGELLSSLPDLLSLSPFPSAPKMVVSRLIITISKNMPRRVGARTLG